MPGEGLGTQDAKAHDLVETPAEIPDWNWQKMMNIQYLFDANRYIHVHTTYGRILIKQEFGIWHCC